MNTPTPTLTQAETMTIDGMTASLCPTRKKDTYGVFIEGRQRGTIGRKRSGRWYTQHFGIGENDDFSKTDTLAYVVADFLLVYVTEPELLQYLGPDPVGSRDQDVSPSEKAYEWLEGSPT